MKLFLTIIISTLFTLNLQSQTKFYKQFSSNGYDYGQGIVELPDSSYVITGSSSSFVNGPSQMFLLKIDSLGEFIWSKDFGGDETDWGRRVLHIENDGFYVAGYTNSIGNGNYDFALWKIDESGNEIWFNSYGTAAWERVHDMTFTSDAGIILVGETNNTTDGLTDPYIVKTDLNGNLIWVHQLTGDGDGNAYTIKQYDDTTYVVSGYKYNETLDLNQAWLTRIHQDGSVLWDNTYENDYNYMIKDFEFNNNNIIVVGSCENDSEQKFYLAKFDITNGNQLIKDISSDDRFGEGITLHGGSNEYSICTAYFGSASYGYEDLYIYQYADYPYYLRNLSTIKYTTSQKLGDMITTYNRSTIAVGYNEHIGPGGSSIYVIRIGVGQPDYEIYDNFSTTPLVSLSDIETQSKIQVYPNPTKDIINIKSDYSLINFEFEIIDIFGRSVLRETNHNNQMNVSNLKQGIYNLIIKNETDVFIIKKIEIH